MRPEHKEMPTGLGESGAKKRHKIVWRAVRPAPAMREGVCWGHSWPPVGPDLWATMSTAQAPQPTPIPWPLLSPFCSSPPHLGPSTVLSPLLTNQCPLYHLVFPGHGLLPTEPCPGSFSPNQSPEVLLPLWTLDSLSGAGPLLSLISSRTHYLPSSSQQDFAVTFVVAIIFIY